MHVYIAKLNKFIISVGVPFCKIRKNFDNIYLNHVAYTIYSFILDF